MNWMKKSKEKREEFMRLRPKIHSYIHDNDTKVQNVKDIKNVLRKEELRLKIRKII